MSRRQEQTAILIQQYFFLILAGLLNHVSLRAQSPLSAIGSQFGILSPTDSSCLGHLVILLSHAHLLLLFFRLFTRVHLLIDGSVEGQFITTWEVIIFFFIVVKVPKVKSNLHRSNKKHQIEGKKILRIFLFSGISENFLWQPQSKNVITSYICLSHWLSFPLVRFCLFLSNTVKLIICLPLYHQILIFNLLNPWS